MKAMYPKVNTGTLSYFHDFFFDVFLGLRYHLFNSCWVNPTILHKTVQRQAGNFPSYRIKSGDNDGFRRIIYDDFNSGSSLKCTDIPAFPADDLAFDIVAFNIEYGHTIFDDMLCSGSLDGIQHNLFGLLGGTQFGLIQNVFDVRGSF